MRNGIFGMRIDLYYILQTSIWISECLKININDLCIAKEEAHDQKQY